MHRSRVGLDAQKPGLARELHKAKFRACHEKKLAEISRRVPGTGTLDNRAPYTAHLVHLKTRPKKKAILAARDAEVERANRDLLRQMTRIFTKPSALVPACDYVDGGGNGGGGRGVTCASINVMCRKRELERIALENKHLVKHLGAVSSSYDVAVWEKDRTANRKIMERLRTVRYERRKTAPQEFSRRGVRHLRKQVEQTRGQAFEAGFAPVPRLFSSARVARRARPESNGHRRRKPGNTSPSREHRVLRGGQGRKRGRRDRDLKIRRSSSERAAELVRAEDATGTLDHTKCIAPNHAEGGVIHGSGGVNSPPGCEVPDGISVSVRRETGSGELAAVVACDGGGGRGQEEQDEEQYSEFADDDNERLETGGTMVGQLQEHQDGEEQEQEQYSEFEDEDEEGSAKSDHNDNDFEDEDPTQDTSSPPPAGDSSDQPQEVNVDKDQEEAPIGTAPLAERGTACETTPSGRTTRELMARRDETVATTTGAKQPQHPSEADKMRRELHLNPASADAGESRMGTSDAVAMNHTATASPGGDDGLIMTISNTQQEPTATGGTATAAAAPGAVVSEHTPAKHSDNSAIRERWVGKPSGEHAKQSLEAEGGIEPGEQPALPGETLNETSGVLPKEISAETPDNKFGSAVDRVPAAVDAPENDPHVELEPTSGAKLDGEHHQGGFRNSPAPVAIPPFSEDCDESFPLSGESEDTVYSEFGDAVDVDEKGSAEMASVHGGSDDGKGKTGHGGRGEFETKTLSHSDSDSKGTGTGGGQSLVSRAEGSKEDSFDGGGGNIVEDSGSAPVVFESAAEDKTAVSAPAQRISEENAGYTQERAEKPTVVNGGSTTVGSDDIVVGGFKPEIATKAGERSHEKHGQVVEELDEAPATDGERQEDKSGAVMPALASSISTGDGGFEAQRLDATEQGSGGKVIPVEGAAVFEADAAMDTEGPKQEEFNANATLGVTTDDSIQGGGLRAEGTEAAGSGPAEKTANIPESTTAATDREATNEDGDILCDEMAAVGSADHEESLDAENALAEITSGSERNVVGVYGEGAAVVSRATEATEEEGGSVTSGVSSTHHRVSKNSSAGEAYVERETSVGSGGKIEETNEDDKLVPENKEWTGAASKEAMEYADEGSKATAAGIQWGKGSGGAADPGGFADNFIGYDSFETDSTEGTARKAPKEIDADSPETATPAAVDVEKTMEEEEADVVNGATVDNSVTGHSCTPENVESTGSGSHLNTTPVANGERFSALAQPSAKGADSVSGARVEYSTDGDSLAAEGTEVVAVGNGVPQGGAVDTPQGEGNRDCADDAKGDAKTSLDTAQGATTVGDVGQPDAVDRTEGAPKEPSVVTLEGGDAAASERTPSTREAESMSGGEMGPPVGNSRFEPESVHGKIAECDDSGVVVDSAVSGDISAVERGVSEVVMSASGGATVAASIGGSGFDDESTGATEGNPSKDVSSDVSKADSGRDNGGAEAEEAGTVSGEAADTCTIGDSFEAENLDEARSVSEKPPPLNGGTLDGTKVATGTDAGEECESTSRAGPDNSADHSIPEPESMDGVGASDVASTAGGGGSNSDYQVCPKAGIAGETVGAVSTMIIPVTDAAPAPETAEAVPAPAPPLQQLGATNTASALPQTDLASEGPEGDEQTDQSFDPELATGSAWASQPVGGNDLSVEVVPGDATLGQVTETSPLGDAKPASSFSSADLIVGDGEGGNSEPVLLSGEDEGDNIVVTPASERAGAENTRTNAPASLPSGGTDLDDLPTAHALEHDGGAGDAAESPSTPSADRDEIGDSGTGPAPVSGAVARNTTTVDGEESKLERSVLDAPLGQEDAGGSSVAGIPTVEYLCHQAGSENPAVDAGSIDDTEGVKCATIGGHDECAEHSTHSEQEQDGIAAGAIAATDLPQSSLENQEVAAPRTATVDAAGGDNPTITGDDDTVAPAGKLSSGNSSDTTPLPEPSHSSSAIDGAVDSGYYGAQASEPPTPDAASRDPRFEPPVEQAFQPGDRVQEGRGDGGGEVEAREGAGSRIELGVGAGSDGGQRQNGEDDDCYAMFDNASSSLESLGSSDPPVVVGPSEDVGK